MPHTITGERGDYPPAPEQVRFGQADPYWLGQAVAVLDFHTPRHAAESGQVDRFQLERRLRQLEYQSALPAEHGGRPVDTAWLRTELGLQPGRCATGSGPAVKESGCSPLTLTNQE